MKKDKFFDLLHEELSNKYNIDIHAIGLIRSFAIDRKMDRLELMDWSDEKLKAYKIKHQPPKKYLKILFNFLENLEEDQWNDINQKTEYDK